MLRIKCLLTILLITLFAAAQSDHTLISGTVLDETGEPLIGASLKLKSSGQGTVTDIDGHFALPASAQGDMVTISYIGYEPQTMSVSKLAQQKTIRLQPDRQQQIEEIVVTGMQKMDKRLFTGATTKLKAEDTKIDGLATTKT